MNSVPTWDIHTLLRDHSVLVCIGTGGVGKTSVSATLGVHAAALGLRTLVMTIDPAKRLVDALGIALEDAQQQRPCQVPASAFAAWGLTLNAPLSVMVPNTQAIFDALVTQFSKQPDQLLRNPIYRYVSTALSGAHDYAAVEKLYRVHAQGDYDLIILDTPPSHNALDFFTAPTRIADFFDSETLQWLQKPYQMAQKWTMPWLNMGASAANTLLSKLAGAATLSAVVEFLQSFQGMYDGFVARSRSVRDLLRSPKTAFVLITTPQPNNAYQLWHIQEALGKEGFVIDGVVVNRMRQAPYPLDEAAKMEAAIRQSLGNYPPAARDQVVNALTEEAILAERDNGVLESIGNSMQGTPIITLPELSEDIHDREGLRALYTALDASRRQSHAHAR